MLPATEHGFHPGRVRALARYLGSRCCVHHRLARLRRYGEATAGLRSGALSRFSRGAGHASSRRARAELVPAGRLRPCRGLRHRSRGARRPGTFTHLVLIAPTWRRPPADHDERAKAYAGIFIRKLIHAPVIGELFYRLNVSRPVVRMMYQRHVLADPAFLTDNPPCRSHPSDAPARRPLCFGLLRHRRPRPVRRPSRVAHLDLEERLRNGRRALASRVRPTKVDGYNRCRFKR